MPSFWSKDRGFSYVASNYNMETGTHGGHEQEHKEEIERITNEIIDKKVSEILDEVISNTYYQALNDLLSALKVDINSIVEVAFSNAAEIFYGEKCQSSIKNALYNEVVKNLKTDYIVR